MKNFKFEQQDCITELTQLEASQIDGGGEDGFWYGLFFVIGATARGLVIFATEGGNNAGLVVK